MVGGQAGHSPKGHQELGVVVGHFQCSHCGGPGFGFGFGAAGVRAKDKCTENGWKSLG